MNIIELAKQAGFTANDEGAAMNIIELAHEAGLGTSLTHNGGEPRVWIEGADWQEVREQLVYAHIALSHARGNGDCPRESVYKAHIAIEMALAAIRAMKEQA